MAANMFLHHPAARGMPAAGSAYRLPSRRTISEQMISGRSDGCEYVPAPSGSEKHDDDGKRISVAELSDGIRKGVSSEHPINRQPDTSRDKGGDQEARQRIDRKGFAESAAEQGIECPHSSASRTGKPCNGLEGTRNTNVQPVGQPQEEQSAGKQSG